MQSCMSKWSFSHHWVVRKKRQQEDYCGCQSVTRFKLLLSHTIQIAVLKITLRENFLELIVWESAGLFSGSSEIFSTEWLSNAYSANFYKYTSIILSTVMM